MKKIYMLIPLLLTVIALYTGCRRQEPGIVENVSDIAADSVPIEANAQVLEEEITVQEIVENYRPIAPEVQETIENYGNIAPELYSSSPPNTGWFQFQIEGNFTNSGNREIVAFYGGHGGLNSAFCFVLDTNEEKIEEKYYIKWFTITSSRGDEMETVPGITGDLARYVMWGDWRIGYVGDFNGNGKEELYLLSISGRNRQPYFFEFDEMEFVQLLDIGTIDAVYIDSVDIEKKLLSYVWSILQMI